MYAIRSYYARGVLLRNLETQQETVDDGSDAVIGIGELQELVKKDIAGTAFTKEQKQLLQVLLVERLRITSYNVCYTKLLRYDGSARTQIGNIRELLQKG